MPVLSALLVSYRELLCEVDDWFQRCSLAAGDQVTCKRGCSACCRGLFDITLLDAWLLRDGIERLDPHQKQRLIHAAQQCVTTIRTKWPDFDHPYLFNHYPEDQWEEVMPEDDETPCPLLGDDGLCLVYDSRPMTCRLNGIPMIDTSGEVLFDEWCTLNFTSIDPLQIRALQFHFNDIFTQEQLLFREFTRNLLGKAFNELDTVIPVTILIDFLHLKLPENLWNQSSS